MKKNYKTNKKFNLSAASIICAMLISSSNAFAQTVSDYENLKDEIQKGTADIDVTTDITFDDIIDVMPKDVPPASGNVSVTVSGNNGGGSVTFSGKSAPDPLESQKSSAFDVKEDNSLTLKNVTVKDFNQYGDNKGAVNNSGNLTLTSEEGKDVTFENNSSSGSGVDLYQEATGSTTVNGEGGKVSFKTGISGEGTITHSGNSELELSGDNSNFTGTFSNDGGKTTVKDGAKFFGGKSTFSNGELAWEAKGDSDSDLQIELQEQTKLTVGAESGGDSNLTLGSKSTISENVDITVNDGSTLTFSGKDDLTLSKQVKGSGTLDLKSSELTLNGNSLGAGVSEAGFADGLKFKSSDSTVTLKDFLNDLHTLKSIWESENNKNLKLVLNNYSGTGDLNVDGTTITSETFEGDSNTLDGKLTVTGTGTVTNNAETTVTGDITVGVSGTGSSDNNGSLTNNEGKKLTVEGANGLTNYGKVTNNGEIITDSITNGENGEITIGDKGSIKGSDTNLGNLQNSGTITNSGSIVLSTVENSVSGNITGSGTGSLQLGSLNNNGGTIDMSGSTGEFTVSGNVSNSASGTIIGKDITFGQLTNESGSELTAEGKLTLTDETFSNPSITNSGSITAGEIEAKKKIDNQKDGEITTTSGSIKATDIDNQGNITANEDITATGSVVNGKDGNKGTISGKNITVSGTLTNTADSMITASGDLSVTEEANNSGNISGENVTFSESLTNNNSGSVIASEVLSVTGAVTNADTSTLQGKSIEFSSTVDNKATITATDGNITVGSTLTNAGNFTATGNISVGGALTNNSGKIQGKDVTFSDTANNSAQIAGDNITFEKDLTNNDNASVKANKKLNVKGAAKNGTTAASKEATILEGQSIEFDSTVNNNGTITATAGDISVAGELTNAGDIKAESGNLTASSAVTNAVNSTIQGQNLEFDSTVTNSGNITANGSLTAETEKFTNEGKASSVNAQTASFGAVDNSGTITVSDEGGFTATGAVDNKSESNLNIKGGKFQGTVTNSGNIDNKGALTFENTVSGDGTITNSGDITLKNNSSGFTGTYTQTAGSLTVDTSKDTNAKLFGGNKNINGGELSVTSENFDYNGKVSLGNNSSFNFKATGENEGIIDSTKFEFTEDANGANAHFSAVGEGVAKYTLSADIENTEQNNVTFDNSEVKLSSSSDNYNFNYNSFNLNNSTLNLKEENDDKSNLKTYNFKNFNANGSNIDFNVHITKEADSSNRYLATDVLKFSGEASGTLGLGDLFITGEENVETGFNVSTKEGNGVIQGSDNVKLSGSKTGVKSATTAFEYDINVSEDGQGLDMTVTGNADEHTLYKVNGADDAVERQFQFSTKDTEDYHIGESLGETTSGKFTVKGRSNKAEDSVLSGLLKKESSITDEKGSFFNIGEDKTGDKKVDLHIENLTVQDANKSGDKGGSVLSNESADSKVFLENVIVENNSSDSEKGGAVYNNGGSGVDPELENFSGLYVHDSTFKGNKAKASTGLGGAIYNDTEGYLALEDVQFEAGTDDAKNDLYNSGTAFAQGTNTFSSLVTNEGEFDFSGQNTFTELDNNKSGNITFSGTTSVDTFKNNAKAVNEGTMSVTGSLELGDSGSYTNENQFTVDSAAVVTGGEGSSITNKNYFDLQGDASEFLGNYTQESGQTDVTGKFFGGESVIKDGVLNYWTENDLGEGAKLTVKNDGGGTTPQLNVGKSDLNANLTLKNGSEVDGVVNIEKGSKVTVGAEGSSDDKLTLEEGSRWAGEIDVNGGELTLNAEGSTQTDDAVLKAEKGTVDLQKGNLHIGTGSSIADEVTTKIGEDTNLYIDGTGEVTIGDGDINNGSTYLNGGKLTFDGNPTTGDNAILQAVQGELLVTGDGTLTLTSEKSEIQGEVNVTIDDGSLIDIQGGSLQIDDDDDWEGAISLNGGTLNYSAQKSGTLTATEGNLNLLDGSKLTIKYPSDVEEDVSVNITKGSEVEIEDGAKFTIDKKSGDKWNGLVTLTEGEGEFTAEGITHETGEGGQLHQSGGKSVFKADSDGNKSDIYIDGDSYITGGDVSILDGSNLRFGADVPDLQSNNLTINDGSTLGILGGTINSAEAENAEVDGTANFEVDLNPRNRVGDQFKFKNLTTKGDATLNVSDFNFTGGAPIDRYIYLQLFDGDIAEGINFTATDDLKFTPLGWYGLQETDTAGLYRAYLHHYNPQAFRGQVATLAAYTHQLMVSDMVTNHFILQNERLVDKAKNANKYAAGESLFTPYQKTYEDGGLWAKTYVSLNTLDMTHGLSVGSNIWGTLAGADLPAIQLNKDWTFIPSGYVGYNAGHQHFSGVSMQQNGGQLGVMGTFIRNQDFITSVTAYGGGYTNDMDVAGYQDNTANWFAGTAVKTAYNYHPFKDFIFQPNLFASYNAFGQQNWGTDFGIMSMSSNMMNGVNVAPGANLIFNKKTWSLYGTLSYMYFINDTVDGKGGNVNLPNVRMEHGYIQYGLGGTKTWKDNLTAYGQVNFRNAGITGVGFQFGLNYLFDLKMPFQKKKAKAQTVPDTYVKKVYKTLNNKNNV